MKKIAIVFLSMLLVCLMAVPASAASAFSKVEVTKDVEVIDSTADQGGNNKPIQFVDGYGIGYSQIDDVVAFRGLDFGANGAKAFTIFFSFAGTDPTTIQIFVDDYKSGKPICDFSISTTGGWKIENAKEFTKDVTVAGGKHDVFVKFTNKMSGSFSWIKFTEADAKPAATTAAAATTAKAATTTTTKAAQTVDMSVIPAIVTLAASAGALVITKRKSR